MSGLQHEFSVLLKKKQHERLEMVSFFTYHEFQEWDSGSKTLKVEANNGF